jgi:hypothetical protein
VLIKVKKVEFGAQDTEIVSKLQKEVRIPITQIKYLRELLSLKSKGFTHEDIHYKLMNLQ